MSNPPRRSRPKKPATTIDIEAKPTPAVGYPGPTSSSAAASSSAAWSGDDDAALDAEARVADAASDAGASGSADGHGAKSAAEAFAEEESLAGPHAGGRATGDIDETILSAAVPDFVADDEGAPTGPPAPTYDYNQPSAMPPAESRGGFGSVFGGAVLGAILALAGAGALQYAGYLPAVGVEDNAEAFAQFARTGDVQQVSTDLQAIGVEVEQLRSAQAAGGTGGGASTADLTAVTDRVTALEQRGDAGSATSTQNQEAAGAAQAAADRATETAEAARQAADAARQTADGSKTAADQAIQTADTASQAAQTASQAAATASQAATAAQASATTANEAIAAFETRLAAIETANKQAGIAISAAALKAAIDRGGPFMSELEGFATAAGASPAVETLRGFAAEGVPSAQGLAGEWPEVEGRIAAALRPADPNASVRDQLLSGLGALVTSRPVGASPAASGEGPSAVLGRLATAIAGGNFQGWLDEWQTLPQAAKDASGDFRAKVEARARTEAVVGETLNNAVNAGGEPAGTAG